MNARHVGEDDPVFRIDMLPNHVVPAKVRTNERAVGSGDREARRRGVQALPELQPPPPKPEALTSTPSFSLRSIVFSNVAVTPVTCGQ